MPISPGPHMMRKPPTCELSHKEHKRHAFADAASRTGPFAKESSPRDAHKLKGFLSWRAF